MLGFPNALATQFPTNSVVMNVPNFSRYKTYEVSMNKRYPEGSMESRFMQDAATAFASLALIEAGR